MTTDEDVKQALALDARDPVVRVARACANAGGRALVVGGWVRDRVLRAIAGPDARGADGPLEVDLEVYGLAPDALARVLSVFGRVKRVGRAFPVMRVGRLPLEIGLPRRAPAAVASDAVDTDERTHADTWSGFDPLLGFAEAALGRDLRVNAMGFDPLTGELLDPHGGVADLRAGRLRATCAARFGEDPLRGLRTAQLAARLELEPDAELRAACAATDLAPLPGERLLEEWRKLLLRARQPSRGIALLRETGLLRFFPELDALANVPQDPRWHPEGDVFTHTLRVVDAAARERNGGDDDLALMFGALCHDLGKPATTTAALGRVTARRHSRAGLLPTDRLLERLRAPNRLALAVRALVLHHLAPREFVRGEPGAGPPAYRRLARQLRAAGVARDTLVRLARADHAGGIGAGLQTEAGDGFPNEALFVSRLQDADRDAVTHTDVVLGRHAIARGLVPGPELGSLLARCREIQLETGSRDPEQILDLALAEHGSTGNAR